MNVQNLWLLAAPNVGPQTVISDAHPEGVVATVFSDEEGARQAAAEGFHPVPLPALWQARILAREGYAGLLLDGVTPVHWVTTEPAALPTHLLLPYGQSALVIGADGVTALTPEEVEPWRDLQKFDLRTNATLLGELPFYGYRGGIPLFEYLPDGSAPVLAPTGGALLQRAGDARESVAFFSTPFAAEWYWEQIGVPLTGEGEVAREIVRHDDLAARLAALTDLPAEVAIILNPGRHRFYQGFFRYLDGQWYLITINGLWHVNPPFDVTRLAKRRQA